MSRWIDAKWLMKYFKRGKEYKGEYVLDELKYDAPSIDICFCRECKHASDNKVYGCMLNHFNDDGYHRMYADDFCSYGERSEP